MIDQIDPDSGPRIIYKKGGQPFFDILRNVSTHLGA